MSKINGASDQLPIFGKQAAINESDLPVTRQELVNFFNNAVASKLQILEAKVGSFEAFLVFLQEVGMKLEGDHVQISPEEVIKWGSAIRAKQEAAAAQQTKAPTQN